MEVLICREKKRVWFGGYDIATVTFGHVKVSSWVGGWVDGWMAEWMDGWMACYEIVCKLLYRCAVRSTFKQHVCADLSVCIGHPVCCLIGESCESDFTRT